MSTPAWMAVRGTRAAQGKIRVLVVDDSVVIRHLVMHALREEPDIEVVGAEAISAITINFSPRASTFTLTRPRAGGNSTK